MSDLKTVCSQIPDFQKYSAGLSVEEIQERFGIGRVIKMASNENPLGTSPVVAKALADSAGLAYRYAQAGTPNLHSVIADHLGVSEKRIVAGNGSDEIIDLLVRVKARPGVDNVIAFDPCFAMYKLQSKLCGVEFRQTPLNEDFSFPWDDLAALADENTALCFVTSPDNPSGYTCTADELAAFARRLPEQCILVIDEAYIEFVDEPEQHSLLSRLDEFPNVVITRTFSKMYGLAGLRLGYGIMPEWLADYCLRIKLPFSVNIMAEVAAAAALKDNDFVRATRDAVAKGREYLTRELSALGCRVRPSKANFFLMDLPESAPLDSGELFEKLLERGIIVRPMGSYDMPRSMRISVGNDSENRAFIDSMKELLG